MYFEIKNSGFEKKLIAGIVLTGGGAQLKHIDQLAEFSTGMDTRIGYPNEHLANDVPDDMASPMYATGVGLVIEGIHRLDYDKQRENFEYDTDGNKKAKKKKKKTQSGEPGSRRFLNMLENWFDSDASE
jgi:cell division protein FtsA